MASFSGNYEVNIYPRQLMNSCQVSLDPTRNLAIKNPIVSSGDDGSNLWTRSSSPGRNHSLHRHHGVHQKLALNFFFGQKEKKGISTNNTKQHHRWVCIQDRLCKGEIKMHNHGQMDEGLTLYIHQEIHSYQLDPVLQFLGAGINQIANPNNSTKWTNNSLQTN